MYLGEPQYSKTHSILSYSHLESNTRKMHKGTKNKAQSTLPASRGEDVHLPDTVDIPLGAVCVDPSENPAVDKTSNGHTLLQLLFP